MNESQFTGTSTYIATDDLKMAVNAAVTLERPILIKGGIQTQYINPTDFSPIR